MDSGFWAHDHLHLLGDSATHPIEPRWRTLAVLRLLAGMSPQRRRALPARPNTAQHGPLGRVQLRFLG